MNKKQGRKVIREYAKELGMEALGEKFISDGERGANVPEETDEYFWTENFIDDDQVREAFFEDYVMAEIDPVEEGEGGEYDYADD
jgi:hypothetical protein